MNLAACSFSLIACCETHLSDRVDTRPVIRYKEMGRSHKEDESVQKAIALLGAMLWIAAAAAAQDSPPQTSSSTPASGTSSSSSAAAQTPARASARSSRPEKFDNYSWQLGFGYSYTRFNKFISGQTASEHGINTSIAYFFKDSFAIEGETSPGTGSVGGVSSKFIFYGGGVRLADRSGGRFAPWAHALFGGARFHPRTAAGLDSVAYEVGGGVDWRLYAQWSVRVQGDWIGTRLFNTSQNSIKIASGIVFHF